MWAVAIDGIAATLEFGAFGTFSERVRITFASTHPTLGDVFMTKYFTMPDADTIVWGTDDKRIRLDGRELKRSLAPLHAQ